MKKTLINLFVCLTLVVIAQPSWAQKFYKCVGSKGELSYKESPCTAMSYAESRERAARQAVNQRALESVKRDIVKVKRELIDLDRFYEFNVPGLSESDRKIFTSTYKEDKQQLRAKLAALKGKRSQLVEQSFGLVADAR